MRFISARRNRRPPGARGSKRAATGSLRARGCKTGKGSTAEHRPGSDIVSPHMVELRISDMHEATKQRFRLSGGPELYLVTAGEPSSPAVLLLPGFPNRSEEKK